MKNLTSFLLLIGLIAACGPAQKETAEETTTKERTAEEEMRLKQYMVAGKQLYDTYCVACHQAEGKGLAQLYPPLAGADYLLAELPRAACMIKNGKTGEITVNGVVYNQMMPANTNLAPLEIAELVTYITNSWGNEKGLTSVTEVTKWLEECGE